MFELGPLLTGIGGLLVGLVAVISLITAAKARKDAAEARRVSPTAMLEGLRQTVAAVSDAHEDTVRRHQIEREGLERALKRERVRADGAELTAFNLQAAIAELRIDLAGSKAEVADLSRRFEASIGTH